MSRLSLSEWDRLPKLEDFLRELPKLPKIIRYQDDFDEDIRSLHKFDEVNVFHLVYNGRKVAIDFTWFSERYRVVAKHYFYYLISDDLSISTGYNYLIGLRHLEQNGLLDLILAGPAGIKQEWAKLLARDGLPYSVYPAVRALLVFFSKYSLFDWSPLYLEFISTTLPAPAKDRYAGIRTGDVFLSMHEEANLVSYIDNLSTNINKFQSKEAEAERSRLAYYDPLTNLPNRRLLYDRLGQALVGCQRTGHFGALLFLDMDNFKNLNDTRGHDVGDQLLVDAAKRIEANVREGDTVARLGGDEFVVVLEGLSNTAAEAAMQTRQVSEKIRDSITWPYDLSGREFYCTCSIGITMFHDQCESIDILLKQADMAMYKAKDAGRNALRFFDPAMQTTLDDRSEMEEALRWAVQRDQFHLYFQSQIDGERRVVGAEALLRWLHPERGWVSPRDFIPLAEETSLILPIGHWALNAACLQLKAWSVSALTRELWLAVNVSTRQFRQPEFVDDVQKILVETGIDPTRLKLELTESLVIHNVADTISKMMTLKALGIRFSMDDFGTGYSSLSYLKLLPLSQLKIDRSFIAGITSDANDSAIVRTIITMGQVLGLQVIAEGVETEDQLTCLQQFGCQAFQGFLFGEPMALSEFESSLQTAAQSKPESPLPR